MDVIVPVPKPAGAQRISDVEGLHRARSTCDRCCMEETDQNPVALGPPRPSMFFAEMRAGRMRRDALCRACRILMGVRW